MNVALIGRHSREQFAAAQMAPTASLCLDLESRPSYLRVGRIKMLTTMMMRMMMMSQLLGLDPPGGSSGAAARRLN